MAHDYTPKLFLRQTPNDLLKVYFERRALLGDLDWEGLRETGVDPLYEAWQALDETTRGNVENDFRQIHDLATDEGVQALIEEGHFHKKELGLELDARDGFHNKAMWAFLDHPRIFRVAGLMDRADHADGRYRRKRKGMPKKAPDLSQDTRVAFRQAISAYYWNKDGRGRKCQLDVYLRGDRYHYFFVYLEDYASTFIGFDLQGQFVRHAQKPAFDLVFIYDPVDGTLGLFAPGDRERKQDLQTIFAEAILHENIGRENRASQPYDLTGLKYRSFPFETQASDGITEVRVKELRLSLKGNHRQRITIEGDLQRNKKDVYDLMDHALDDKRLPLAAVDVDHATIQVAFSPVNGKARRQVTFRISCNACTLKEKPEHLLLVEYLKRWKIALV
jgi:hypothetical protein